MGIIAQNNNSKASCLVKLSAVFVACLNVYCLLCTKQYIFVLSRLCVVVCTTSERQYLLAVSIEDKGYLGWTILGHMPMHWKQSCPKRFRLG